MQKSLKNILRMLFLVTFTAAGFITARGTVVRELTVDGILYRLEFLRNERPCAHENEESYSQFNGAFATVLAVNDISPKIPDYIEYEGIKYYVYTIDDQAFSEWNALGNTPLAYLDLPKNCSIDTQRGYNISQGLISLVIPDGKWVGGLEKLEKLSFVKGVTSGGEINYLRNLREVIFSVRSDAEGFYDIGSNGELPYLNHITFGPWTGYIEDSFNTYDDTVWYDFKDGATITCLSPEPPTVTNSFNGWYSQYYNYNTGESTWGINGALHVPAGCGEKYRNADFWKDFGDIYEDVDFGGNMINDYTIVDGIIYGLYPGFHGAKVIGPVDREVSTVNMHNEVSFYGSYYDVTGIADLAFFECRNLTDVTYLLSGLNKVGDYAFYHCGYDNNDNGNHCISIAPATIIGRYAYAGTTINDYMMPDEIEYIEDCAFAMCWNRYTPYAPPVTLPSRLKKIGDGAFADNRSSIFVLPSTVESIGSIGIDGFFHECNFVFHGGNITSIGRATFKAIDPILELPESVVSIDQTGVYGFKNVNLGKNVAIVRPYALSDIGESVTCMASVPPTAWKESFGLKSDGTPEAASLTLHVRKGLRSAYEVAEGWKWFGQIVDDVDEFEQDGFRYRIDLSNSEVTFMGTTGEVNEAMALSDDASDTPMFKIPSSVTYDGVTYPVRRIGKWAVDLGYRKGLHLPESVEAIDDFAIINVGRYYSWISDAVTPPAFNSRLGFSWPDPNNYTYPTVYVPVGSSDAYKKTFWNNFDIKEKEHSGVGAIEGPVAAYNGEVKYYNLEGIRVEHPVKGGLYIERQPNGDVNKIIYR